MTFSDVLEKTDVSHVFDVSEETDVLTIPDELCMGHFWVKNDNGRLTTIFTGPVCHPTPAEMMALFTQMELAVIASGQAKTFMFNCDHMPEEHVLLEWTKHLAKRSFYLSKGDSILWPVGT